MRNLKRVLSLVMAVAMLIGLMVVSASAASTYDNFTDKDEIVNKEAVNTLVSLGVLNGKEDGSYFAPADIVTRAEMAKIITVCLNGGNDPLLSSAVANTGFSDVSSNYWAAPYIAYCANIGIINGKGDGTFGPEEPVTGTAAAKMFLCALGYRSDIEGLTGANWALNTEQLANEKGLYNDMSIVPSNGLSRDNTAQLVYNGIQAQEVEYRNNYGEYSGVIYAQDKGTMLANRFGVVKVEGVVIANEIFGLGSTATPAGKARFVDTNTYTTANNTNGNYNGVYPVSIDNEYVGQRVVIYVKFPNALAPNATDCVVIGEPILSDKNTVATTGDRMKDTDAVKTFLRDNGLAIGTESATPTVAGTYFQGVKTLTKGDSAFADARPTLADGVNGTAGKKVTFIDHTGDGTVDYIITENPTLAQVTVYDETDKELTIAGEGSLSFKEIANPEAVAKGDMALYVKYDDTFYLSKPETVTGEVTAYVNGTPKKVTMDGTNYTASANGLTKTGTTLETLDASQDLIGNSYIFYLDAYGNVVAKDLYEEEFGNYALVIDSAAGTANGTNLANSGEVKLMTNDGTTAVYKVNMLASAAKFEAPGTTDNAREQWMANMLLAADGTKALQYKIVTYVVDGSNVTIGNPGVLTNYGNVYGNSANPVQRSTASYNITDANGVTTNVIVNDSTLFYVMSDSDNNGIVDRFSLIQGLSNVPVSVVTGATVIGAAYQTRTVDNHTTNTAKAVVVQDLQNSFKGTRSFVYVTGNYTQTNDQVKNNIYQYPVVFENGEPGSILVKNTTNATIETGAGGYSAIKSGMIYEYRMNGDYAELFLTSSTYNNYVTSQVSGKSMEIRLGTNGSDQFKDTKTLGTTVINVEDTDKIYVMDSEPTAAMSVAFATNSDGYVNLVFVRDSDVHFRTVYNTTGMTLKINGATIPNGGAIQVANGFDLTIQKADGSAIGAANAKDQVVIYAHNDNSKDSGYETGDINSLGYGVITMPANSTVLLGSITGNKTFSTTIPDGTTTPGTDTGSETVVGNITFKTDANMKNVNGLITADNKLKLQFTPDLGGYAGAKYTFDYEVTKDGVVVDSGVSGQVTASNNRVTKDLNGYLYQSSDKYTVTLSNLKLVDFYSLTAKSDVTGLTVSALDAVSASGKAAVAVKDTTGTDLFLNISGLTTDKATITFKVEGAADADITPVSGVTKVSDNTYKFTKDTITDGKFADEKVFDSIEATGAVTVTILSVADDSTNVAVNYVLAGDSADYISLSATTGTVSVGATTIATGPDITLKGNLSKVDLKINVEGKSEKTVAAATGAGTELDSIAIPAAVKGSPITVTITATPNEYTRNVSVTGLANGAATLTFDKDGYVKAGDLVTSGATTDNHLYVSVPSLSKTFVLDESSSKYTLAGGEFQLSAAQLADTSSLAILVTELDRKLVVDASASTVTGKYMDADGNIYFNDDDGVTLNVTGNAWYAVETSAPTAGIAPSAAKYSTDGTLALAMGDVTDGDTLYGVIKVNFSSTGVASQSATLHLNQGATQDVTTGQFVIAGTTLYVKGTTTAEKVVKATAGGVEVPLTATATVASDGTAGVYSFTAATSEMTVEFTLEAIGS